MQLSGGAEHRLITYLPDVLYDIVCDYLGPIAEYVTGTPCCNSRIHTGIINEYVDIYYEWYRKMNEGRTYCVPSFMWKISYLMDIFFQMDPVPPTVAQEFIKLQIISPGHFTGIDYACKPPVCYRPARSILPPNIAVKYEAGCARTCGWMKIFGLPGIVNEIDMPLIFRSSIPDLYTAMGRLRYHDPVYFKKCREMYCSECLCIETQDPMYMCQLHRKRWIMQPHNVFKSADTIREVCADFDLRKDTFLDCGENTIKFAKLLNVYDVHRVHLLRRDIAVNSSKPGVDQQVVGIVRDILKAFP